MSRQTAHRRSRDHADPKKDQATTHFRRPHERLVSQRGDNRTTSPLQ
jgi:hypothetical protein